MVVPFCEMGLPGYLTRNKVPGESFLILFSTTKDNSDMKLVILRDFVNAEKRRGDQYPIFTILKTRLIRMLIADPSDTPWSMWFTTIGPLSRPSCVSEVEKLSNWLDAIRSKSYLTLKLPDAAQRLIRSEIG
jgi:hypothetical protein